MPRTALNTQLKFVFSSIGADGEPVESFTKFKNATNNAEDSKIKATADAFATLYAEDLKGVREIVENDVTAA